MHKTTYIITSLLIILFNHSVVIGQKNEKSKKAQPFPISIGVQNSSWAFPGSTVFRMTPIYPGISVGSEYHYRNREKLLVYQGLEFGGFLNNSAGSAMYMNTNIGLRVKTKFGLTGGISFGLGYFHGFHPSTIYAQNDDGQFEKVKDMGVGALSANLNFQLAYQIKNSSRSISPFIGYQWIGSTYYWSLITIRPTGLSKLGIRFNLKND